MFKDDIKNEVSIYESTGNRTWHIITLPMYLDEIFWIKSQQEASQSSRKDPQSKHTFNNTNMSKTQQGHEAWNN